MRSTEYVELAGLQIALANLGIHSDKSEVEQKEEEWIRSRVADLESNRSKG